MTVDLYSKETHQFHILLASQINQQCDCRNGYYLSQHQGKQKQLGIWNFRKDINLELHLYTPSPHPILVEESSRIQNQIGKTEMDDQILCVLRYTKM